jgi:hypothetical protein
MRPLLLLATLAAAAATKLVSSPHDDSDIKAMAAWDDTLEAVVASAKGLPKRMGEAIVVRGEGSEWIGTHALGPLPLPAPVPAYTQHGPCTFAPIIKGVLSVPKIGAGAKNGTEDVLLPELTLPLNCSGASGRATPWPVIVFYDGFSVKKGEGRGEEGRGEKMHAGRTRARVPEKIWRRAALGRTHATADPRARAVFSTLLHSVHRSPPSSTPPTTATLRPGDTRSSRTATPP